MMAAINGCPCLCAHMRKKVGEHNPLRSPVKTCWNIVIWINNYPPQSAEVL